MEYKEFKLSLSTNPIDISVPEVKKESWSGLDNDALFQIPFISMVILALAKSRTKPKVSELGRMVGECIELSMPSYKGQGYQVSWSVNLRVRTIKALSFLEIAGLVCVDGYSARITITPIGKKVVDRAIEDDTDLSYSIKIITRQYRNIKKHEQMRLRLS